MPKEEEEMNAVELREIMEEAEGILIEALELWDTEDGARRDSASPAGHARRASG